MNEFARYSVSVAGVTFDEQGRVLLIRRRDTGEWQAPGGILELHETCEEGVAREVFEETGVRVKVGPLSGVYKNIPKAIIAMVYQCTLLSGSPKATDEASVATWLPLGTALSVMQPVFAVRVQDASTAADRLSVSRAHDGVNLL